VPSPRAEAVALGAAHKLALAYQPRRGPAGERLGRGTGASLEFQDRRAYAPGDDVRHLDWRAYARTDQLLVRQFREEILPSLELLVDTSRSMACDEAKAALALDVAGLVVAAARGEGFRVSVLALGDRPDRVEATSFLEHGLELDARSALADVVREAHGLLRPGSLRILVSDFLSPHVPEELVRALARGAGGLALLQVLSEGDVDPPLDTALRLTDAETGEDLDLVVETAVRRRYLERLENLGEALQRECRRHGAPCVELRATMPLEEHVRGGLFREGVLEPA
jgi:uncharacterized protein (DUF58 family)